ncbi:hypothetical protein NC651_004587 [Populus alba x Populus x berolinensis]|nr:hypothetical protein NC651_004587 [Populus alba x Populus x berolinensis]
MRITRITDPIRLTNDKYLLQLPQQEESSESKEASIKKLNWPYLFHENHFPINNFPIFDTLRENTFQESDCQQNIMLLEPMKMLALDGSN